MTGEGPNVTATRKVLDLASNDETLRKALQDTAIDNMLVVTMANLPHADLALNLAFSAARVGAPLFAFALSRRHTTNYGPTTSLVVNYRRSLVV